MLVEFDFSPRSVDVSAGAQTVTVTARVTDATGAQAPYARVQSDTTTQSSFGVMTLVSGTATDGTYQRIFTIPANAAAGAWTVGIAPLNDTVGNNGAGYTYHPDKLTVTVTG